MAFAHGTPSGTPSGTQQQGRNINEKIITALSKLKPSNYDRIFGTGKRLDNVQTFPESIPISKRKFFIGFNAFKAPPIEKFELFGAVDDIKNTDISDTTHRFINKMIPSDVPTQNCFKFLKTMMIYHSAHSKWDLEKRKGGLTDDDLGFMTSYFFAKKNMEYSFNTIYDFLQLPGSSPNQPDLGFSCNIFLLIDLENIIGICREYHPAHVKELPPKKAHDKELMICSIMQWIENTYNGKIIPVFSINNIGVKVKPIQIVRNPNGDITCIFIFANANKGELDDFNISNFCELMILSDIRINTLEPIFHILSFDAMKWWDIKPLRCYVSINPDDELLVINDAMNKGKAGETQQSVHRRNVSNFFYQKISIMSIFDKVNYSEYKRKYTKFGLYLNHTSNVFRKTYPNFIFEEKYEVEKPINENKLLFRDVYNGSNTLNSRISNLIFGHKFDISRVNLEAPNAYGYQKPINHRAHSSLKLSHFKSKTNASTISPANPPQGQHQPQHQLQGQGRISLGIKKNSGINTMKKKKSQKLPFGKK